jgi:type I restriction enzyme S subunit
MKRYERYKPSGIEWIGEIPDHWEEKRLKYSDNVIMGQSPSSSDYNMNENGFPFLQGNAEFGNISPTPKIWCETSTKIAQENDVLLSVRAPIGAVNIADQRYGIGRGLCAIRGLNAYFKFLYYHFKARINELNSIGTGSTYTAITADEVNNLLISYPPIAEQTSIANYLDRKTAQIHDLIAKKQKLIDLLNEEKTAIINQAVTKGLNPDTPMKDSGIPWLGEIPTHWEIKKIKYIANLTLGKMLTGEDKGGNFLKPYLRAQNISWFKCDTSDVKEMWFSKSELIKYRVNLNDLLVSEGGDVGRTCIWMNELDECYIQNSVHKITFKKYFNPKYFLYLFYCFGRKGYFLSIVNQISIGHLTGEKLKEVFTIFPGFDEQTAIVDYLDRKTDQMDDVISKTHHEIELLQEYRTALISDAVTGKIKVS